MVISELKFSFQSYLLLAKGVLRKKMIDLVVNIVDNLKLLLDEVWKLSIKKNQDEFYI